MHHSDVPALKPSAMEEQSMRNFD